jgi:hypothetical protein
VRSLHPELLGAGRVDPTLALRRASIYGCRELAWATTWSRPRTATCLRGVLCGQAAPDGTVIQEFLPLSAVAEIGVAIGGRAGYWPARRETVMERVRSISRTVRRARRCQRR